MFKYVCLTVAIMFGIFVCWCLNNIRSNTVEVLANAKVIAETGAKISHDIEDARTLMGSTKEGTTFLRYATRVVDAVRHAGADAKVGVGEKMKDAVSSEEWANSTGVEAAWLAALAGSPEKIRERLSKTFPMRKDFYIQIGDGAPQKLSDWITANVKED